MGEEPNIIKEGMEIKTLSDSSEKRLRLKRIENKLHKLTKLKSKNKRTNTLVQRIVKHKNDLLRFINHAEVKFHNNRAERAIRAVVIFRKNLLEIELQRELKIMPFSVQSLKLAG